MTIIETKGLSVAFGEESRRTEALRDVNLSVEAGEFVCLVGPSGCGKSTLLNILAGLKVPTDGTALLAGNAIEKPGPERAVVFQGYSLFPWWTAQKNVEFAIAQTHRRLPRAERRERACALLASVGIAECGPKYPAQLSGGQQQRVAIARALATDAPILLMDEPFAALDARSRARLQDLLLGLWEGDGAAARKTVVFVTHDIDEAVLLADRIVLFGTHPGRILEEIPVNLPRPRHRDTLAADAQAIALREHLYHGLYESNLEEVSHDNVETATAHAGEPAVRPRADRQSRPARRRLFPSAPELRDGILGVR